MDWKNFFVVFLRNVVITLGLSTLLMGIFVSLLPPKWRFLPFWGKAGMGVTAPQ